jgi:hypothetical protein
LVTVKLIVVRVTPRSKTFTDAARTGWKTSMLDRDPTSGICNASATPHSNKFDVVGGEAEEVA